MPDSNGQRADMGTFKVKVDPPEFVGELTGPEAGELRARAELSASLRGRADAAAKEERELRLAAAIVDESRGRMLRDFCTRWGLSADDDFMPNDVGAVYRTARSARGDEIKLVEAGRAVEQPTQED